MARKQYSEEEVQKRISQLSDAAADFLYSPEMGALVKKVADKHQLHIDQMALLEAEVGELMLGLTEPQDFVPYMVETLNVSKDVADAIAKDVNDELMLKMRGLMGAPSQAAAPAPAPAPKPASPEPVRPAASPSVVMPSSKPTPAPAPTPVPVPTPIAPPAPPPAPAPTSAPMAPAPKPAPDLAAADAMLADKKVTPPRAAAPAPASPATPPAPTKPAEDPNKPQQYKADPYREPIQ